MTEHERDEFFERLVLAVEKLSQNQEGALANEHLKEVLENQRRVIAQSEAHFQSCDESHKQNNEQNAAAHKSNNDFLNVIYQRLVALEQKTEPWRE